MASGTITTAMIFVWMVNIMMVLSQIAINDMSLNSGSTFVNCSNTLLGQYSNNGNCNSLSGPTSNNIANELPGSNAKANPTTGFGFVDWIASTTSWISKQANTFTQIVMAPTNLLKSIPVFQEPQYAPFAAVIGIAWWGISIFLIVAFIFGR